MTTTTKSKKVTTRTTPARRAQSPAVSSEQETQTTTPDRAEAQTLPDPSIVAALAYRFFEESGHEHGRDQEHWFRAEAVLSRN